MSRRRPDSGLRRQLAVVAVFALAAGLWRAISGDPLTDALEDRLLDLRFRLRGPIAPPASVVLVAVDERTIENLGWTPPPRWAIAEAVDRIVDAAPAAVAIDLLLVEQTAAGPALATALARSDRVVLAAAAGNDAPGAESSGGAEFTAEIAAAVDRSVIAAVVGDLRTGGEGPPKLLLPRPEIVGGASLGHVNIARSGDRVARHVPLALWIGERDFLPAMPLDVARRLSGLGRAEIVLWLGSGVDFGARRIATDRAGRVTLNHYGDRGTLPTVSLIDVVEGRVPPEAFTGRAVIFGATAESLSDLFATPFGTQVPGAEIIATLTANLAAGQEIRRAPASAALLAPVFGLLAGLAAMLRAPSAAYIAVAGVWLAAALVLQFSFAVSRLWLDAIAVIAALGFATVWMAARRMSAERRESRALSVERGNLARYVSPLLTERLAQGAVPDFDRRTQDAAVLFVDVAGYTSYSENRAPDEVAGFLRDLHRLFERAAAAHRGIISGFEGDGAMIIFGLPEPELDDAARAVDCARMLLEEAAAFASPAVSGLPLRLRVSVHYGEVTAAVVGGERQAQVTVTGDTVNVASRLQETAKQSGAMLVLSRACLEAARADPAGFTRLPDQPVRGRTGLIEVWALR